jgi:hypothetical protein
MSEGEATGLRSLFMFLATGRPRGPCGNRLKDPPCSVVSAVLRHVRGIGRRIEIGRRGHQSLGNGTAPGRAYASHRGPDRAATSIRIEWAELAMPTVPISAAGHYGIGSRPAVARFSGEEGTTELLAAPMPARPAQAAQQVDSGRPSHDLATGVVCCAFHVQSPVPCAAQEAD